MSAAIGNLIAAPALRSIPVRSLAQTSTPRAELPPSQVIKSQLTPAPHREAVLEASEAAATLTFGQQILFMRGFGGDRRSLHNFENAPEPGPLAL